MFLLAQTTQQAGKGWYEYRYLGNALWQWVTLLGILLVTLAAARIVSFLLSRYARRLIAQQRLVGVAMTARSLAGPAALLILAGGLYVAGGIMNLQIDEQVNIEWFWLALCKTIAVLAAGWAIYRFVDVIEAFLTKWTSRTQTQLDDQLVPIIRKALRIFVVIILLLFIAQNIFKWDIGALLAGLGLGGLAFALAAQDALKNLFGSVTIFADRPFQMGERVKIGDHDGVIEAVGFRSTRVRTLAGHLVTVPNATVADSAVENIDCRPYIRRVLDVTVTYDTSPEKMERAIEILREMLDARKDHFPPDRPGEVHFSDFNPDSLNIVVYYWFIPPNWWEYLAFTSEFNLELLRRYNAEGIEFAFPTQTLYIKREPGDATDLPPVHEQRPPSPS